MFIILFPFFYFVLFFPLTFVLFYPAKRQLKGMSFELKYLWRQKRLRLSCYRSSEIFPRLLEVQLVSWGIMLGMKKINL